jgi:hypothetical protein
MSLYIERVPESVDHSTHIPKICRRKTRTNADSKQTQSQSSQGILDEIGATSSKQGSARSIVFAVVTRIEAITKRTGKEISPWFSMQNDHLVVLVDIHSGRHFLSVGRLQERAIEKRLIDSSCADESRRRAGDKPHPYPCLGTNVVWLRRLWCPWLYLADITKIDKC